MSSKTKQVFLYLEYEYGVPARIYHSSKIDKNKKICYVLDPSFDNLFGSFINYTNYKKVHFRIYTNDIQKATEVYGDYLEYSKKIFKTDLNYSHTILFHEKIDIGECLQEFTDILSFS